MYRRSEIAMQCISSDTSVWIDFAVINRLNLPFRLDYVFLMYREAANDELLYPKGIKDRLCALGLKQVELSTEEFLLAGQYAEKFRRLSHYDCIALAIAKTREIPLLTGDKRLREVAKQDNVLTIGSIAVMDKLLSNGFIERDLFESCMEAWLKCNGTGGVRLPEAELRKRLLKHDS